MEKDNITRICLWSGPRNISTTLMYSFAQRNDTLVFDEPLYAHYLSNTNANEYHPGAEEILATMENDGEKVIQMMLENHNKSVVFFKNMTHHLLNLDFSFMKNVVNVILTRDPIEMLPSFDKVIHNPTLNDVGYEMQTKLVDYFQENNIKYVVLDSKKVLLNPKGELINLCNSIGIPFEEHMLHWKAEARKEDGLWAKYWYKSIHQSTGFIEYKPKTTPFPSHLKPLLNESLPYYQKLLASI